MTKEFHRPMRVKLCLNIINTSKAPLQRHSPPLRSTPPLTPQTGILDLRWSQCPSQSRDLPATRQGACAWPPAHNSPAHHDLLLAVCLQLSRAAMPMSKKVRGRA